MVRFRRQTDRSFVNCCWLLRRARDFLFTLRFDRHYATCKYICPGSGVKCKRHSATWVSCSFFFFFLLILLLPSGRKLKVLISIKNQEIGDYFVFPPLDGLDIAGALDYKGLPSECINCLHPSCRRKNNLLPPREKFPSNWWKICPRVPDCSLPRLPP